jgi:DNA-binding beta-propeller fold protein YncE
VLCAPLGAVSAAESENSNSGKIEVIASGLNGPYGLFFDGDNLLVTTKGALLRIKDAGQDIPLAQRQIERVTTIGEGDALGAMLYGSKYVVLSCGAGCQNSTQLQVFSQDGTLVSTLAQGIEAGVEVARWKDNFVVTDIFQNRILEITPTGVISVFTTDKLNGPGGMYMDGDELWVTNFFSGELVVVDRNGVSRVVAAGLGAPVGIDSDGKDFIIADYAMGEKNRGRVLRVSRDGDVREIARAGTIGNPSGLVVKGPDIYVSDILANTVTRIRGNRLKPIQHRGRDRN